MQCYRESRWEAYKSPDSAVQQPGRTRISRPTHLLYTASLWIYAPLQIVKEHLRFNFSTSKSPEDGMSAIQDTGALWFSDFLSRQRYSIKPVYRNTQDIALFKFNACPVISVASRRLKSSQCVRIKLLHLIYMYPLTLLTTAAKHTRVLSH